MLQHDAALCQPIRARVAPFVASFRSHSMSRLRSRLRKSGA